MYTRWDEKSGEEEVEGTDTVHQSASQRTQPAQHNAAHALQATPSVHTLPLLLTTRYFNKDILHTTTSPLRVQHASMFMHTFLF